MRRWKSLSHVRGSVWLVPALCVLVGASISVGPISLDRLFGYPASITGHPTAAVLILSTLRLRWSA
jgi:hypothetical protein